MKRLLWWMYPTMILIFAIGIGLLLNQSITVFSQGTALERQHIFVIDAGHGEPDGGTTSYTGAKESDLNLQISHRLNDMLHLLGLEAVMIRKDESSVYTEGDSISAKKISDIKHRVSFVESIENPILISIHQNYFTDSRYSGAQVFYAPTKDSYELAIYLQTTLKSTLNADNRRQPKKADGIYLMQHITCPGVLIECGFLSNPEEDFKLQDASYQKKLAVVIATQLSQYYYT